MRALFVHVRVWTVSGTPPVKLSLRSGAVTEVLASSVL